jgi:hypothetical protein
MKQMLLMPNCSLVRVWLPWLLLLFYKEGAKLHIILFNQSNSLKKLNSAKPFKNEKSESRCFVFYRKSL